MINANVTVSIPRLNDWPRFLTVATDADAVGMSFLLSTLLNMMLLFGVEKKP